MTACQTAMTPELHPALASRFSPVAFDPRAEVTAAQIDTLIEAARRSPSAGNSQPWSFIVATRGDDVHARMVRHLARSSAAWAPQASLLIANLSHRYVEGTDDWEYSEFSHYDLGQAVAHMSIQALSIGMDAHQFRAFDRAGVAAEFKVPAHWEVTTMTAFGVAAHRSDEVTSAGTSRERLSRDEITWTRS